MLNFFHKILRKISSRNAQHISEYSLLIVCVMAGILITGPYVIRSWNALLKSYDTDMLDSFTDPLKQAPTDDDIFCECDPEWKWGKCGEVTYGDVTCPRLTRLQYRVCSPFKCDPNYARCVDDPDCCLWEDKDCGTKYAAALEVCDDTAMYQERTCADGVLQHRCFPNHPMCAGCEVGPDLPLFTDGSPWKEQLCPDDIIDITTKRPFYRVGTCTDPDKCEVLCINGYVPANPDATGNFTSCECPPGIEEIETCDTICHSACGCPVSWDGFTDRESWDEDWNENQSKRKTLIEIYGDEGGPSEWQGMECPPESIVKGINTQKYDKDRPGHNYWWFTCRHLPADCFIPGVESWTTPKFVAACYYPELENPIVMKCPPGQVVTGMESINAEKDNGPNPQDGKVKGGYNWWRVHCKGVKSECIGTPIYDGFSDRFREDIPKGHIEGQESKTCYVTSVNTLSRTDDCDRANNEWWVESKYE